MISVSEAGFINELDPLTQALTLDPPFRMLPEGHAVHQDKGVEEAIAEACQAIKNALDDSQPNVFDDVA